ncbi:hypothetical protein ACLB2K_069874 [Fragaria x ananassa]
MAFKLPKLILPSSSPSPTPNHSSFATSSLQNLSKAFASSSSIQSASIEDVTKSFAASLVLANLKVMDLSHRISAPKRGVVQSFLIVKPLNSTPQSLMELKRFCGRQVLTQPYDDVKSIKSFAMDLFFWVSIQNIPPKYEIPENFPGIASFGGRYIEHDDKLFIKSKKVWVRVEKKLSNPILNSKTIKLATDDEEEIDFYFENCLSICDACYLVFHENGKCRASSGYNIAGHSNVDIMPNPAFVISFASKALVHGSFKFQGCSMSPSTPIATSVLDQKKEKMHRRPTILKKPVRELEDDA